MATRTVTWGEGLVVEAFKHGGLRAAVDRIAATLGSTIGTRNTFAKLQRVEDPSELNERDMWRAWLLLAALGQDPTEWGITIEAVPIGYRHRVEELQDLLLPRLDSNQEPSGYWLRRCSHPTIRTAA